MWAANVLCEQRMGRRNPRPPWIFYGQVDRKGGGRSAPSALTISKCDNFDPFFHWNLLLWYLNTFYLIVRDLKMHFYVLNPIWPGGGRSAPIVVNWGGKIPNSYITRTKWLKYLNWVIIWRFLGELNGVLIGTKSDGFLRVNASAILLFDRFVTEQQQAAEPHLPANSCVKSVSEHI